jgi:flagellar basal-body rod modification protein FlgD
MDINDIQTVPPAGGRQGEASPGAGLAETFDSFLLLLTTQLQHQDPLSPMDANEFTQQLVDFTGVEQAIFTNRKLDQLIAAQAGNQLTAAVSFIGKTIEAETDQVVLQDGRGRIIYTLDGQAADTTILVVNEAGQTVRALAGEVSAGRHEIAWDGTSDAGAALPDGLYGFLLRAVDPQNQTVTARGGTAGRVTGVEITDGKAVVTLDELAVPLEQIRAVREADDTQAAL